MSESTPATPVTAAERIEAGILLELDVIDAKAAVDRLPNDDVVVIMSYLEEMGVKVMTPEEADYDPRVALKHAVDTNPVDVGAATLLGILNGLCYSF